MLLEVLSLSDLVHYFQSIYNNVMFEVKGLIINEAENDILVQTCVCETMKFKFKYYCGYLFTLLFYSEILCLLDFKNITFYCR